LNRAADAVVKIVMQHYVHRVILIALIRFNPMFGMAVSPHILLDSFSILSKKKIHFYERKVLFLINMKK